MTRLLLIFSAVLMAGVFRGAYGGELAAAETAVMPENAAARAAAHSAGLSHNFKEMKDEDVEEEDEDVVIDKLLTAKGVTKGPGLETAGMSPPAAINFEQAASPCDCDMRDLQNILRDGLRGKAYNLQVSYPVLFSPGSAQDLYKIYFSGFYKSADKGDSSVEGKTFLDGSAVYACGGDKAILKDFDLNYEVRMYGSKIIVPVNLSPMSVFQVLAPAGAHAIADNLQKKSPKPKALAIVDITRGLGEAFLPLSQLSCGAEEGGAAIE